MKLTRGKLYIFEYCDAAYSDKHIPIEPFEEDSFLPRRMVTVGRLEDFNNNIFDIATRWTTGAYARVLYGIIIPRKGMLRVEPVEKNAGDKKIFTHPKIMQDEALILRAYIAVYWDDVRAYENDTKKDTPTKMLTEGVLIKITPRHIFLHNPETLNLTNLRNHPETPQQLLIIPKNFITEIHPVAEGAPRVPRKLIYE